MSTEAHSDDRLTLICPNLSCRRTLHVPPSARGKVMRCAYCGAPFRVPPSSVPDAEAIAAAREDKNE